MTHKQIEDYNSTFDVLQAETALKYDLVREFMDRLHRAETTLHRIYTDECNQEISFDQWEKARITEAKIKAECSRYGLGVRFNADPRGGSVRLIMKHTKRYNTWDGETWGIFW